MAKMINLKKIDTLQFLISPKDSRMSNGKNGKIFCVYNICKSEMYNYIRPKTRREEQGIYRFTWGGAEFSHYLSIHRNKHCYTQLEWI